MTFFICWAIYALIGMCLIPMFAKDSYELAKSKWTHQPDRQSMAEGAFLGWAKSLIWPIWLGISIAIHVMTSEQRAAEAKKLAEEEERKRKKTVEEARAIIALDEAQKRRAWEQEFRA